MMPYPPSLLLSLVSTHWPPAQTYTHTHTLLHIRIATHYHLKKGKERKGATCLASVEGESSTSGTICMCFGVSSYVILLPFFFNISPQLALTFSGIKSLSFSCRLRPVLWMSGLRCVRDWMRRPEKSLFSSPLFLFLVTPSRHLSFPSLIPTCTQAVKFSNFFFSQLSSLSPFITERIHPFHRVGDPHINNICLTISERSRCSMPH